MNQEIKYTFEVLELLRNKFLQITDNISLSKMNTIPSPAKNNIIWNIVHAMVSTDLLTYGRAGEKIPLSNWVESYRKGTNPIPTSPVTEVQLEEIKSALLKTNLRLMKDYEDGLFKSFEPYQTHFGVKLDSIEYAIIYAVQHEMLHFGYIMALRKLV